MSNSIEKFYNEKVQKNVKQGDFLGYLHQKLKRHEKHRYQTVKELTEKIQFKNVLDIGCNDGSLLKLISTPQTESFGIDISQNALKNCDSFDKFEENFSVQNIDEGLSFSDEKFDLITMVAVLEHVFDPIEAIKEINRILKKDGHFIVEVPNIAFIKYRFNLLFGKRPRTSWDAGWDGGHLQYFTKKDLEKLISKNGFEIIHSTGSGIFCSLRKWWKALLMPNIIILAKKI